MAHSYSKLYNIPSTGLRFFTVYGPAGRPDISLAKAKLDWELKVKLDESLAKTIDYFKTRL